MPLDPPEARRAAPATVVRPPAEVSGPLPGVRRVAATLLALSVAWSASPGSALGPGEASAQQVEAAEAYRAQIEALRSRPGIEAALERVRELQPWALERLIELTEIPAPPFGEEERAARYAELLRAAGADSVWTDAEGNVLALRRGASGQDTVALGGHLDTVFPEGTDVTVRQRGDTLFAPGIGDDTRGLVDVLTVLRALEEAGVETEADVLFVGVVGEEGLGDLRGMKHIFRDGGPAIDAWIEIDGGDLDRIVSEALGSKRYRVTFRGPGGHSWGDFGMANPAHGLGRAIRAFQAVADTLTRSGPPTSYNVGRIGGGTSVNSIPFEAWMEVDMRSESPAALDRIEAAFVATMEEALDEANALRREGPPLEVDVERIGDRPSGAMDPSAPLVQRALAAAASLGFSPSLARSSTDANIPIASGVAAVTVARGGEGGGAHSPNEWWIDRESWLGPWNALLILLAQAGVATAS